MSRALRPPFRDLAVAAGLASVAAVVLYLTSPRGGGDFFVAMLAGLGVGLGLIAIVAWRRERG